MGRAELMLIESRDNPAMHEHCRTILDASKRARDLIKQILAFSREVDQEIKPVFLAHVLQDIIQLVRPTLPTTIALEVDIQKDLSPVMADETQLHQVVMNLATNAFHAMEETGGTLSFTLREKVLNIRNSANTPFHRAAICRCRSAIPGMEWIRRRWKKYSIHIFQRKHGTREPAWAWLWCMAF